MHDVRGPSAIFRRVVASDAKYLGEGAPAIPGAQPGKEEYFIREGQHAREIGFLAEGVIRAFFLQQFENDVYEQHIGKARLLKLLYRLSPVLAGRILRNG